MTSRRDNAQTRRGVLLRYPDFRRFFLARSLSYMGDGIARAALLLYVQGRQGTGAAVGVLLVAQTIPRLLVGPVAGALADRAEQRRLMVSCDLAQLALYVLVALWLPPFPALVLIVGIASGFAALFTPAGKGSIAALVRREDLLQANAWSGTALNLQLVLGPALGAILFATIGARAAFAVNAATFLASAVLLTRLPKLSASSVETQTRFWPDLREGFREAARNPVARVVLVALVLVVSLAGLDDVALVFLTRSELDGGAAGFGFASSAYGIGMLIASLFLVRVNVKRGGLYAVLIGIAFTGAGALVTGLAPILSLAFLGQAVAGIGNGSEVVGNDTLLQQHVDQRFLGRIFGLLATAAVAGSTIAAAAGGVLLDATSARTVFVVAGVGTLVVFVGTLAWLPSAVRRTPLSE